MSWRLSGDDYSAAFSNSNRRGKVSSIYCESCGGVLNLAPFPGCQLKMNHRPYNSEKNTKIRIQETQTTSSDRRSIDQDWAKKFLEGISASKNQFNEPWRDDGVRTPSIDVYHLKRVKDKPFGKWWDLSDKKALDRLEAKGFTQWRTEEKKGPLRTKSKSGYCLTELGKSVLEEHLKNHDLRS